MSSIKTSLTSEIKNIEKIAPTVISGLRDTPHQKYLSPVLRQILLNKDWDALSKAEDPAIQARFKLLRNLRDNALNLVTENKRLQYQLLAMSNLAEKIMKSNTQSSIVKHYAPNLVKTFKQKLPELIKTFTLYKGIGRIRQMNE